MFGKGGVKYDDTRPRWDLLPMDALNEVACVLRFGANKYAARNWEKGMAWGRLYRACLSHLAKWSWHTERDMESGEKHLAHAACCALMLLALVKRNVGIDDRSIYYAQNRTQEILPKPVSQKRRTPRRRGARKTTPRRKGG